MSKDKLKQKAEQLKEKIQSRGLDISFDHDEDKENVESIDMVKHIQMKVEEMDEEANMCTSVAPETEERKSLEGDHAEHPEIANSSFAVQHAFRKAELCKQLQELTKALAMKEEIASKMVDNERITSMRKQYEVTVKELEHIIEKLEKEKAELNSALNTKKANPSALKKEKERLRELETQLSDYKKKQIEYKRLQKTKEQSDQTVTKLDAEIKGMKQMKVKLMRQMKEEAEKFRQWKLKKDKEINQLKQQ
ncbi:Chromosome-associated kinesin KIF4A, partial [Paramuricea clavata]